MSELSGGGGGPSVDEWTVTPAAINLAAAAEWWRIGACCFTRGKRAGRESRVTRCSGAYDLRTSCRVMRAKIIGVAVVWEDGERFDLKSGGTELYFF